MGIGITLTSIVFYACNVAKQLQEVNNAGYICSNYSFALPNKMNKQHVLDMVSNYYHNQYTILHSQGNNRLKLNTTNPFDSRAVFFSLDSLEKMFYYIRKASKNYSNAEKQNLGVNIYFASYPEADGVIRNNYNYTNRHTVVFVPSIFNTNNNMPEDIDLLANLEGKIEAKVPIKSNFYTTGGQMFALAARTTSNSMMSQNNGTGTPPPPPAGNTIDGATGNPLLDITSH